MSEPAATAPAEVRAQSKSTGALAGLDGVLEETDTAGTEAIVPLPVMRLRGPGLTSVAVDGRVLATGSPCFGRQGAETDLEVRFFGPLRGPVFEAVRLGS